MNILIPDSWLREYIQTPATPKQIMEYLSLCGPTVEKITKVGADFVYEIEVTSNRVDMASVLGIAREAAAILPRFGIKAQLLSTTNYKLPTINYPSLPMDISDLQNNCNRILGVVMEIESVKPSKTHIKERLEKSGIRSLNNLVDITNYLMLELGHPSHVFDYDRIKTHKFIIRKAKKGEPIITLDNKKYLLSEDDVIIDDGTGRVIDLPGIMGTENSVVNDKTKRIIFFIESNKPEVIRKTSMRYGIRTMAATINEKHPDPELAKTALLRGIELYQELAGAKIKSEIIDIYPTKTLPKTIQVSTDFINERLGIKLPEKEITDILKSLNFKIESSKLLTINYKLQIIPPTYRQFDVTIPEDIVEEVARIYGYHNLPTTMLSGAIPATSSPQNLAIEEKIKIALKYWGHTETYHYSFYSKDLIQHVDLKTVDHLKVSNPLTEDTEFMRINLIPQMLETISKNQSHSESLQLFELSKVYIPRNNGLPSETSMLAVTNQSSFYHLKGIVEGLYEELGIKNFVSETINYKLSTINSHFFHPLQSLQFLKSDQLLGIIGKLHPALATAFGIKKDTFIAYLNIENMVKFYNPNKKYTPIPQYPPIIEDFTLPISPITPIGPIMENIYKLSNLVANVELVSKYHDKITLRITFQDPTKNLTIEEIKILRDKILKLSKNYKL
ncbi:phenylalanine--tRNA ligase subunit beta [Candidatus Gottesmanbacteria bacterium RIFCSPHIGHO2_01_FULL_39_10]|uniref:Phenylalanine--tRNA ligase beta subunit n=1 Tax=Candidatus Gottesmanbacteria bacterium RIFCSPHIGHO2_01_FULL_39_10 TaxID=1798375 RepID=A0A1F5ZLZ2_9BACT|nr:MAG: phenylalanine--tRNA ligase subunit beta [Candidatus Gottesmanbacteria bacterium RIFCSPHIGHO2_01_FULL_39_10]